MDLQTVTYFVIGAAVLALIVGLAFYGDIRRIKVDNPKMLEIAGYIKDGAMAYLKRQYRVLGIFIVVMFLALAIAPELGITTALCFVLGSVFSIAAGFIGMMGATAANVRTASEAQKGIRPALNVAFSGGSILGMTVVGLGALGMSVMYLLFQDANTVTGFCLGASSIALFCRVGGGIYTKAADMGADLVGKVEADIPEDDPRNPAVIADNVGDNVGDVAGMGADLFESYVDAIVSAILLGVVVAGQNGVVFTLLNVGVGILASIIAVFCVRLVRGNVGVHTTLRVGTYVSAIVTAIGAAVFSQTIFGNLNYFWPILAGIIAGLVIGASTEYYTSSNHRPVRRIVDQTKTGPATTILSGFSIGMKSTAIPLLVIVLAVSNTAMRDNCTYFDRQITACRKRIVRLQEQHDWCRVALGTLGRAERRILELAYMGPKDRRQREKWSGRRPTWKEIAADTEYCDAGWVSQKADSLLKELSNLSPQEVFSWSS